MKNKYLKKITDSLLPKKQAKIFCIGQNKTGTTSIQKAFIELGFKVGDQRKAELLWREYWQGDFDSIIKYCKTAEVFQDFPFSFPNTYKYLDKAFPNSKFILTVRNNPDEWYSSVINFHAKLFGNGRKLTLQEVQNIDYITKGWIWNNMRKLYDLTEDDDPYDEVKLKSFYIKYNMDVLDYFSNRKNDLLVLNLSEKKAYKEFCDFIGVNTNETDFPWENKTSEI